MIKVFTQAYFTKRWCNFTMNMRKKRMFSSVISISWANIFLCFLFRALHICAKCRALVASNVQGTSWERTTILWAISSTPRLRTLAPVMALFTRFCKWPKGFNVALYVTASHHFKKRLAKVIKLRALDSRHTRCKNSISNVQQLSCVAVSVRWSKSPAMQVLTAELNAQPRISQKQQADVLEYTLYVIVYRPHK